jgi:hypothetical protein
MKDLAGVAMVQPAAARVGAAPRARREEWSL